MEESRKEHLFGLPVQPCQRPPWWPSPTSPTAGSCPWSRPKAGARSGSRRLGSSPRPPPQLHSFFKTLPWATSSWKLDLSSKGGLSSPGLPPPCTPLVLLCRCWIPPKFRPPVSDFSSLWETGTFPRAGGWNAGQGRAGGRGVGELRLPPGSSGARFPALPLSTPAALGEPLTTLP